MLFYFVRVQKVVFALVGIPNLLKNFGVLGHFREAIAVGMQLS
jgi:hypothetical protein